MALALLIEGDVKGRLLGDLAAMEQNSKAAIAILKNEKDPVNLSKAYYKLAIAYVSEGKADPALDAAATAKQVSAIAGDRSGIGWAFEATGLIYAHHGDYWKSFENMIESLQIGQELNDSLMMCTSLAFIGRSFNRVGDPQTALNYYRQALRFATPFFLLWPAVEDMAYAHMQLKQYDSVIFYQQKHRHNLDSLAAEPVVLQKFGSYLWGFSAEIQLARRQYDEIISSIVPQLPQLRTRAIYSPG